MATPEPVTLNDYQNIVADYHSESDRAAIVLAGSFVEHYLANYLKHFMAQDESTKPLFSGFGPFSTFAQRISAAYAFKLIPSWVRDDLLLIKQIRNHFAHSPRKTSLSDSKVQAMLSDLSTAKDPAFNAKGDGPLTDGRLIYLFAVARFTVFAHTTMQNHPNTPTSTI